MKVSYLGCFEIWDQDRKVALPKSKKARALCAYLSLHPDGCSRQALTELFFSDTRDPKGNLRWCISRIRSALGVDSIITDSAGARFNIDVANDIDCFFIDLRSADMTPLAENTELLSSTEFLSDLQLQQLTEFESWRTAQEFKINAQKQKILSMLVTESLGESSAIDYAQNLVAKDPTLEESWVMLIRAHAALGKRTEAKQVFEQAVEYLKAEDISVTSVLTQSLSDTGIERLAELESSRLQRRPQLKPSLVVGPCFLDDYSASHFSVDSVADAVHRAAAVNSSMTIAARTLAMQLQDCQDKAFEMAQQHGIDFVLTVAISSSGEQLLAHIELASVAEQTGCFHWNYARPVTTSPMKFVADLESYLSARFEIDLLVAMAGRSRDSLGETLSAYDNFYLALPCIFSTQGFDPPKAEKFLLQAIHRQPDFGQASAALAMVRTFIPAYNSSRSHLDKTISYARRAVEICQNDAFVLGWMAAVLTQLEKNLTTGHDLTQRALTINPCSVVGHISAAIIAHYQGNDDACLQYVDRIESITDVQPLKFLTLTCKAMVAYQQRNYKQALNWSQQALGHNPRYVVALRYKLASLGQMSLQDEANALCDKIVRIDASENLAFFRRYNAYHDQPRALHMIEGLSLAGLPETYRQAEFSPA